MIILLLIIWVIAPLFLIPAVIVLSVCLYKKSARIRRQEALLSSLLQKGHISRQQYDEAAHDAKFPEARGYQAGAVGNIGSPANQNHGAAVSGRDVWQKPDGRDKSADPIPPELPLGMPANYNGDPAFKPSVQKTRKNGQLCDAKDGRPGKSASPYLGAMKDILIIGVVFILLAGLIFTTTSWQRLENGIRAFIICSVTALFFTACFFAERVLRLRRTGLAFYVLGSLFLPISLLAAGYFGLLGPWLSVGGEGRWLLAFCAAFLLGGACLFGCIYYKMPPFGWGTLTCVTLCVSALLRAATGSGDLINIGLALYCVGLVVFIPSFMEIKGPEWFPVLTRQLTLFGSVNAVVLATVGMAISYAGWLSVASSLIFAGAFFLLALRQRPQAGALPSEAEVLFCAALVIVGFFRLGRIYDSTAGMQALMITLAAAVLLGLSFALDLPARAGRLLRFTFCGCVALFFLQELRPLITNTFTFLNLLAGLIVFLLITAAAWRFGGKLYSWVQPVAVLQAAYCLACMLQNTVFGKPLTFTVLCCAGFMLYRFRLKLFRRVPPADFIFPAGCLLMVFGLSGGSRAFWGARVLPMLAVLFMTGWLALEKRKTPGAAAARYLLPHLPIHIAGMFLIYDYQYNPFSLGYAQFAYLGMLLLLILLLRVSKNGQGWQEYFEGPVEAAILFYGALGLLPVYDFSVHGMGRFWLCANIWELSSFFAVQLLFFLLGQPGKTGGRIGEKACLWLGGVSGLFAFYFSAWATIPGINGAYLLCMPAAAVLLLTGGSTLQNRGFFPSFKRLEHPLSQMLAVMLPIMSSFTALTFLFCKEIPPLYAAIPLVMCSCAYWFLERKGLGAIGFIPCGWLYPVLHFAASRAFPGMQTSVALITLGLFALFTILSRLFYRGLWQKEKPVRIDWLLLFNFFAPWFLSFPVPAQGYLNFAKLLLVIIYVFLFRNRLPCKYGNSIVATALTVFIVCAFWMQPFFTWPKFLSMEVILLPIILLPFIYRYIIWKNFPNAMETIQYVVSILSVFLMAGGALLADRIQDGIILGVCMLAVLLASFALRRKRWFWLGAVTLLLLGVYFTRAFWLSLAWWIYLLAAGVLMIAVGALSEWAKQKGGFLLRWGKEWRW